MAPADEHIDDERAVTNAYGENEVTDSSWGRVSWAEWCDREMARINAKGDKQVRVARGFGRIWLTEA